MTLVFGKPTGGSGGGGASAFTGLSDTPTSYSGQGGKATRVNAGESAVEFYTPTDANDAVKVSSNDTTAGFLNGKLLGGTNVTLVEGTDGGNETLTIDASVDISGKQNILSEGAFVDGDKTKLDAIEASADVTATAKFVKLTTTSTADANPSSEMKIAWDTLVIDEKDDAITHSISTNNSRITLDQDGYYRGFVNIGFNGSAVRGAPQVRVKVNDTTYLPEEARNTYIRATSNHNDSSANFSFVVEADAGDYIEVTSIQGAAGGTLNIDGASLTVEKYEIGKQGEKGDPGSGGTVDVVSNVATDRILGRNTAGTGDSEELTAAAARTLLNVEDGATADQTGAQIKTAYEAEANAFTDTKNTKLSGIESDADKTDTANVEAAGALMDSEVTNLAQVKAFDSSDYEPTKEIDDNYVTDDEKVVIGNTSGTNTGDQDINIGDQVIIFENNLI